MCAYNTVCNIIEINSYLAHEKVKETSQQKYGYQYSCVSLSPDAYELVLLHPNNFIPLKI
jgi:hypothetical protein